MLMMPQARSRIACSAWCADRMHSSRQMGVASVLLQFGVVDDFVVAERLLDHHEVEFVEPLQMLRVGEGVGGVGVGHQADIGEALAHAPHHVHVPARLDFDLDALIAGGEFAADLFDQLLDRILNADRNPAGDLAPRAAADLAPQRHPVHAGGQVPGGRFEGPARHQVAADVGRERRHRFGSRQVFAGNARGGVVAQDGPGGFGPLLVIEGVLPRGDLAPAGDAAAGRFHQDHLAFVGAAEAGLEEMHQRHADLPQDDALDLHGFHAPIR